MKNLPTEEQIEALFSDDGKVLAAMLKTAKDLNQNIEGAEVKEMLEASKNMKLFLLNLIR